MVDRTTTTLDPNVTCYAGGDRGSLTGAVSSSAVSFTVTATETWQFSGSFTTDLMGGTVIIADPPGSGSRGCFQVSRSGALPNCNNPFQ